MTTVTGILQSVVQIGGETTGWTVSLDTEASATLGTTDLEIDPAGKRIDHLKDKCVRVSGDLIIRTGIERGDYQVLVVESIEEI